MGELLKRVQGLEPGRVRVAADSSGASLLYGAYERVESRDTGRLAFSPKFQHDIELIRSLSTGRQTPMFRARPELIGGGQLDDAGQWHVSRARGPLTLLIARFYNTATFNQRVEAAEQYVDVLREQGLSAYYEHQPVRSLVYVGDFNESDRIADPRTNTWLLGPRVEQLIQSHEDEFRSISDNGHILKRSGGGPDGASEPSHLVPVPARDDGFEDGLFSSP
jgi:hypothetical protein